jgi:hypothetical protein
MLLQNFREPLKIHFGEQANLFDSGRRQRKAALASTKADFSSLPETKNLLLIAQKQLLELPFSYIDKAGLKSPAFFILFCPFKIQLETISTPTLTNLCQRTVIGKFLINPVSGNQRIARFTCAWRMNLRS